VHGTCFGPQAPTHPHRPPTPTCIPPSHQQHQPIATTHTHTRQTGFSQMTARIAEHCHALRPGALVVSVSRAVPCAGLQLLGRRRLDASWGESTVYYQSRLAGSAPHNTLAPDTREGLPQYSGYSGFNSLADDNTDEQVSCTTKKALA
jgi:hypothetical protein